MGPGPQPGLYRATDAKLDRDVALKVLPQSFDPERLARFEREARVLAQLNHPNIAAIYGFEQVEGVPVPAAHRDLKPADIKITPQEICWRRRSRFTNNGWARL